MARARPLAWTRLITVGAAPGSIIAAIIAPHTATKDVNVPSRVATPMSIPLICRAATTQHAAASPSVAVSVAAVTAAWPGWTWTVSLPALTTGPVPRRRTPQAGARTP